MQLVLEGTLLCTTAEGLLHSLAELLGEDGVEKGVAAGVNGEDQHYEPLGSGGVNQPSVKDSRQSENAQWSPAEEVHNGKQENAPDELPISRAAVSRRRSSEDTIDAHIEGNHYDKSYQVDDHKSTNVELVRNAVHLEWKAYGNG